MRLFRVILAAAVAFASTAALADNVRKVTGDFTFYGDGSMSRDYCKSRALEGARLQAIAREFGTLLSQSTIQDESLDSRGESTFFSSLSSTEVKGEWIADASEPEYTYDHDSDGNIVVTCRVAGTAKAISNDAVDFEALVLRNGCERRYADTRFRSGDDLRLLFQAPADGYTAVYLVGADRTVYTLLPYLSTTDGRIRVKHGKEYLFFDSSYGEPQFGRPDEMTLTTDMPSERNLIYVVYSPNEFTKGVDVSNGDLIPRSQSYESFARWLTNCRRRDSRMNVKVIPVIITPSTTEN